MAGDVALSSTETESQPLAAVDLSNCAAEPIHIPGRIQSFGALIGLSTDWIVTHASENAAALFSPDGAPLLGRPASDVFDRAALHNIRARLQLLVDADGVERLFAVPLNGDGRRFDVALHLSDGTILIEAEPQTHGESIDYIGYVRPMIGRIDRAATIGEMCEVAAHQLRRLTGFDRVMVYRFEPDDSGTVIAESLRHGMAPYRGLRYPASDVPPQARALYTRNPLRIIADAEDMGLPIAALPARGGKPLDLSLSTLRAVSPIHLEYLRNMGVGASMSISILLRGRLWGMFACHNQTPKTLGYDFRTAAELFAQMFALVLDQKTSAGERAHADRARAVHDQLMVRLADGGSVEASFDAIVTDIASVIDFDGVVGWFDGRFTARGTTPDEADFAGLVARLNEAPHDQVLHTDCIEQLYPPARAFADAAAGMLVLPMSRSPSDYIVLFREEIVQSVAWAGDPAKPVEAGTDRISPRKSFAAWQQVVRGHSAPWAPHEIAAADALRVTLLEVVLRMADSTMRERLHAQERQELLIAELNHRVRNILNLIRSLIAQSRDSTQSPAEFTEVVGGRIHALARAHDQITRRNWEPASLQTMIMTEADAYLGTKADRVLIAGPNVLIVPAAFMTLSLVIHELMTNSAKYGALSDSRGTIAIDFAQGADGALIINWRERGGPKAVTPPKRRGFGTTIIERAIPHEFGGTAEVRYDPEGVSASFGVPAAFIAQFGDEGARPCAGDDAGDAERTPALAGEVLVVEDNLIIALEAEQTLLRLGAGVVHVAGKVREAIALIDRYPIGFALLDVNLGDETSAPVAAALRDRGIRYIFASGYGDAVALIADHPGVPIVTKPYQVDDLRRVLAA